MHLIWKQCHNSNSKKKRVFLNQTCEPQQDSEPRRSPHVQDISDWRNYNMIWSIIYQVIFQHDNIPPEADYVSIYEEILQHDDIIPPVQ